MTVPRTPHAAVLADHAVALTTALRADGRHDHVTVRAARGALYVEVEDAPVLRLECLGGQHYGISFHSHTGRWEPTPFQGAIGGLAETLLTAFGPHLDAWDFPPRKSGSGH